MVTLFLFETVDEETGIEYEMIRDSDGVWEAIVPGHHIGRYYGYRVQGPNSATEYFDGTKLICDPYSRAVATRNEYLHRGKTLIIELR